MLQQNTALVLEGGGMRCVFTTGVLDCFMDHNVEFPYMVAVSGGTNNALSLQSRQRGRSYYAHIPLMKERPYVGIKTFVRKGSMIDLDLLYEELVETLYPFDFETFFANKTMFEIVATNCLTGEAQYMNEKSNPKRLLAIGRASCSLPLLSPVVDVEGVPMLDGGLSDSIPLQRALDNGYQQAVVVLTQNKGFRKRHTRYKIPGWIMPRFPAVRTLLQSRSQRYNDQLDWIEKMEAEGKICVIRPQRPLEVGRLTNDTVKLQRLYDEGYALAEEWLKAKR